jgi:hypothetical protein
MTVIQLANAADAIQSVLVAYMATQSIGGIRGINHYTAGANNIHGLAYQASLGIIGVYLEKLAQRRLLL